MLKKIAVIGAGWAGAAAAWQLHKNGKQVTVFESAHTVGGRARQHSSTLLGQTVDNGQHILLGAYCETLALMQEMGIDTNKVFYRFDLDIHSLDDSFRFKTAPLPAPLHLLGPLLKTKGIGLSDRLKLISLQSYLVRRRWQVPSLMTVSQLLKQTKQPLILIQKLWTPLCIAALNTPIDTACAQLFAQVLKDSLGAKRQDTQMLIALRNMSDLWATRALQHADLRLGHSVRQLEKAGNSQGYKVNGEVFDGVVIATNSPSAARLTRSLVSTPPQQDFLKKMQQFQFNAIATLYLQPEKAWKNPYPMQMLNEHIESLGAGQWVFNHAAIPNSELKNIISISISDANWLQNHSKADITAAIIKQIKAQTQIPLPKIIATELISEKRATFVAIPGLNRPTVDTPWADIKLAGDWVQSEYPAVLEGAVRSGLAAANTF